MVVVYGLRREDGYFYRVVYETWASAENKAAEREANYGEKWEIISLIVRS